MRRLLPTVLAAATMLLAPSAAAQDPGLDTELRDAWLRELEGRIAEHAVLGGARVQRVDVGPFTLYVEDPPAAVAGHLELVRDFYGPWLVELESAYRREIATPLSLARRDDRPALALYVLASQEGYDAYAGTWIDGEARGMYDEFACYDDELGIGVTYRDWSDASFRVFERNVALQCAARALRFAYSPGDRPAREHAWIDEGMAGYLAANDATTPASLRAHPMDPSTLEYVARTSQRAPSIAIVCMPPVVELAGIGGFASMRAHLTARREQFAGHSAMDRRAQQLFFHQSSLWMHFLLHGGDGEYRPHALRFLASAYEGSANRAAFDRAFEGVRIDELDKEFRAYVNAAAESAGLPHRVRPFASAWTRAKPEKWTVAEDGSLVAPTELETAPLDPSVLAVSTETGRARFAFAVADAAAGRYSAAAAAVRALLDDAEADGDRERWEREAKRLDGVLALRRAFFEHVMSSGKKLNLMLEHGRLLAKVEGVDDELVMLGSNRYGEDRKGIERLALDALDPLQLADAMRDRDYGFDPTVSVAYAYALANDEDLGSILDDYAGDADAKALRRDAADDYPVRVVEARVIEALDALAEAGVPADEAAARDAIERAATVMRDGRELGLVVEREIDLRELARLALGVLFANADASDFVSVPVEDLGGGRVRLAYDFDLPNELDDFGPSAGLDRMLATWKWTDVTRPIVRSGHVYGSATHAARHVLDLADDVRIVCRVKFTSPKEAYDPSRWGFQFGYCDDAEESYALTTAAGALQVWDRSGHTRIDDAEADVFTIDVTHEVELTLSEGTLVSKLDGKVIGTVPAGPRTSGAVFFASRSGYASEIERLVIEGRLSLATMDAARDAWVAKRLRELGF